MRWEIAGKPEHGHERRITKFAWFPIIIGNQRVWLEHYYEFQLYWKYQVMGTRIENWRVLPGWKCKKRQVRNKQYPQ